MMMFDIDTMRYYGYLHHACIDVYMYGLIYIESIFVNVCICTCPFMNR